MEYSSGVLMQSIRPTTENLTLLILLDKMDENRAGYDQSVALGHHRKATEFFKQIRRLAVLVDQLTRGEEHNFLIEGNAPDDSLTPVNRRQA